MDSALAPLPEAFLRHKGPAQPSGHSSFENDGGPPLAGGLLRPPRGTGGAASSDANSQWSLKGMSQMRWLAWRQEESNTGNAAGTTSSAGAAAASIPPPRAEVGRGGQHAQGSVRNDLDEQGLSGHTNGKTLAGRPVGPFGNGAGAVTTRLPASSRIFGDTGDAEQRVARPSPSNSWQRSGAALAARRPERTSGDSHGGGGSGGSRGTSNWMPDMILGSGAQSSSSTAATWSGALAHPENVDEKTSSHMMSFSPPRPPEYFSAGPAAGTGYPSEGKWSGTENAVRLSKRPEETTARASSASGFGQGSAREGSGAGATGAMKNDAIFADAGEKKRAGAFGAKPFSRFNGAETGAGHLAPGSFGTPAEAKCNDNDGDDEEEDNPFA